MTGLTEATLPVRRCECSFCRRHGAAYTSDPAGAVHFELAAPDAVRTYRFASRTVDFLFCRGCGVMTAALSVIDGITYAVVNANTLDTPIGMAQEPVDYGGETPEQGRERRRRNWIGRVEVNVQGKRLEEWRAVIGIA